MQHYRKNKIKSMALTLLVVGALASQGCQVRGGFSAHQPSIDITVVSLMDSV